MRSVCEWNRSTRKRQRGAANFFEALVRPDHVLDELAQQRVEGGALARVELPALGHEVVEPVRAVARARHDAPLVGHEVEHLLGGQARVGLARQRRDLPQHHAVRPENTRRICSPVLQLCTKAGRTTRRTCA